MNRNGISGLVPAAERPEIAGRVSRRRSPPLSSPWRQKWWLSPANCASRRQL